jgi:hypothetical protein
VQFAQPLNIKPGNDFRNSFQQFFTTRVATLTIWRLLKGKNIDGVSGAANTQSNRRDFRSAGIRQSEEFLS